MSTFEPSKTSQLSVFTVVDLPDSRAISFFPTCEFQKYLILCMQAKYFEISLCHIHHLKTAVELSCSVVVGNAPLQGLWFFSVVDLTHAVSLN